MKLTRLEQTAYNRLRQAKETTGLFYAHIERKRITLTVQFTRFDWLRHKPISYANIRPKNRAIGQTSKRTWEEAYGYGLVMGSPANSLTAPHRVDSQMRQDAAVRLRIQGYTLAQIAKKLGYCDTSAATKAIRAGLANTLGKAADELRQIQSARIDELWRPLYRQFQKSMKPNEAGEVVPDYEAADRLIKLIGQGAVLAGCRTGGKVNFNLPASPDMTPEQRVASILGALQARAAQHAAPAESPVDVKDVVDAETPARGDLPEALSADVLSTPTQNDQKFPNSLSE